MSDVLNFLQNFGLDVTSPVLDGSFQRHSRHKNNKSAWYVGWSVPFDVCIVGDWATGEKIEYKKLGQKLSRDDKEEIKRRIADAARRSEIARKETHENVRKECFDIIKISIKDYGEHDYLKRKKVSAFGTYFLNGELYIPLIDRDGKLWSFQKINQDGQKFFMPGGHVKDCFHIIGEKSELSKSMIICEGYATGASCHMATDIPVVVAFNAGNLLSVAKIMRDIYETSNIIIAGDDDRFTAGNPGKTKAAEAAKMARAIAVFPSFQDDLTKPTDFNDLHNLCGLNVVRDQILQSGNKTEDNYIPLGYDDSVCFFYSLKYKKIVRFNTFSSTQFYSLLPKNYWEGAYPGTKDSIDWESAKNDLIQKSKDIGCFNSASIRGVGVWYDANRVIFNAADGIYIDGVRSSISKLKSRYIYITTANNLDVPQDNPLTTEESMILPEICRRFAWKDSKYSALLSGWIAIARIAGALPIRPHIWITGGSGTGKSTIMEQLMANALGKPNSRFYAQGATTEAGLRQSLKADSLPVIFDEFEVMDQASTLRINALIELMRQSWSQTSGTIIKGGADGLSVRFSVAFAACVSSIRVGLNNDADKSRFSILELTPHSNIENEWQETSRMLQMITQDYGERLFARSLTMVPTIIQSYDVYRTVLAKVHGMRYASQYGMLYAGYSSLISDKPATIEDAEALLEHLEKSKDDETVADHEDCYNHLLDTIVNVPSIDGRGAVNMAISEIIGMAHSLQVDFLKNYGILVRRDYIWVSTGNSSLKRFVYGSTRWSSGWSKSLARIPKAVSNRLMTFGPSSRQKCTGIPRSI